MPKSSYAGLLFIGDPHLESRQPGFRKDDYPTVILDKLGWCLEYARTNHLLPAILGDLFDKPRDNPNWMIARLLDLFHGEVLALYGNHDCADPVLREHDSLSLLIKAGRLRLLEPAIPWQGVIGGRPTVVGGSSYRQEIPKRLPSISGGNGDTPLVSGDDGGGPLVIWLTHHDVLIPGYDEGRIKPFDIEGVDLLINGHIHRRLDEIRAGRTRWLTPGNISRRSRNDATRDHVPSVLRLDVMPTSYELCYIEVPHRPFDEVFHECIMDAPAEDGQSAFIRGLAELQTRRTASGAGLLDFLKQNVGQFAPDVSAEIMNLAQEVTHECV